MNCPAHPPSLEHPPPTPCYQDDPDRVLILPFSTVCVLGAGQPLTSLHPGLLCLPLAELLTLPP